MKKNVFWLMALVTSGLFFLLQVLGEAGSFPQDLIYTVLCAVPLVVGVRAVREFGLSSVHGKAFGWFLLGIGFWVLGELVWLVLEWFFGIDPYPSIADGFYLIGYLWMFVGLYFGAKFVGFRGIKNKKTLLLNIVFAVILLILVGYFGVYGAYDPQALLMENIIGITYGLGDMSLVIWSLLLVSILGEYKGGKILNTWYPIVLGMLVFLAADVLYAIYYNLYDDSIRPYIYMDTLWVMGYLFFAVGFRNLYETIKNVKVGILRS